MSPSCASRGLRLPALLAVLVAGVLLAWAGTAWGQDDGAVVDVLQLDGPIDGRVVGHVEDALDRAEAQDVEAVVLQLATDGGLRSDGVALAERIDRSGVPLAVWVGPPGARVTGAGALLAQSGHVLAMAPATVLGAAEPLDLATASGDGRRAGELLAAYAQARGRDPERAAAMAHGAAVVAAGAEAGELGSRLEAGALPWGVDPEQVSVHDDEALRELGVADVAAVDLPDVLRQLDGHEVTVIDGAGTPVERTIDLDPVTAHVRFDNLSLVDRVLHAMASPALAYLLVIGGALGIMFELYQPGFGVAGGAGVLVAALGVYGLVVLPTSGWALALMLAGLAVLAVDLALAGLGRLTLIGTAALGAGSYWLFDGPPPLQPPTWLIAVVVAFCVLFFVVIMTTVLRAQGAQAMAGAERVIGRVAVVRSMLNPEGHVYVDGALWRARAPEGAGKVPTGTQVRIVGMSEDGLTLEVSLDATASAVDASVTSGPVAEGS